MLIDNAALGEQFSKEYNEAAKRVVIMEGDKQAESLFVQMIEYAKSKGEIESNIDTLALSMMLQSLNRAVIEQGEICFRLPWWGKGNERFSKRFEFCTISIFVLWLRDKLEFAN
jgi:hypothetical protein